MSSSLEIILSYLDRSNAITIFVLGWLSIYFIITVWVYVARYLTLKRAIRLEEDSLESLVMGSRSVANGSFLEGCLGEGGRDFLNMCKSIAEKEATKSLAVLSVIASTSPFIGLFGTVVSI